jgi:EmrB/QacA subfamily drug resistance transporter
LEANRGIDFLKEARREMLNDGNGANRTANAPTAAPAQTQTPTTRQASSTAGRWILAASVLGSGAVFVESTVVTVALPAMGRDLGLSVSGLQWVMNGYLLTLSALMLLGGALGDTMRRSRVFVVGLIGFAIASLGCAVAPTAWLLVVARVLQGVAGAMLVPNSLALLETSFTGDDRGAAIGHWAGWSAVSTAIGPLVGGVLVEVASWRFVFLAVAPLALVAAWIAARHSPPNEKASGPARSVDWLGALLVTLGLAGVVTALIVGPTMGFGTPLPAITGLCGIACLAAFVVVERRVTHPLLPFDVFESLQFSGANLTTLFVYAALSGLFFVLMLQLQNVLGYGALAAGASLLPINALMLLLSSPMGRLAHRMGPRAPMTVGPIVAGLGMLLFARVQPATSYLGALLPATIVFGVGLSITVAPLTATVLAAVSPRLAGVASAVNNAVARLAGLLATAALPAAAGFAQLADPRGAELARGFVRSMWICAALCAVGGAVAFATVRRMDEPAP